MIQQQNNTRKDVRKATKTLLVMQVFLLVAYELLGANTWDNNKCKELVHGEGFDGITARDASVKGCKTFHRSNMNVSVFIKGLTRKLSSHCKTFQREKKRKNKLV